MQVLVISQYWQPENGVPQRRWQWLAGILRDQGHEVTVVAPPPHYDRKMSISQWLTSKGFLPAKKLEQGRSGERIVRSGFFPAGASLTMRAINQAAVALGSAQMIIGKLGPLKSYHPDLIIGTVPALPTSAVTWVASKRFGAPYVIDLRDAWPDLLGQAENWNEGTGKQSLRQRVLSVGVLQAVSWFTRRVIDRCLRDANAIVSTSSELAKNLRQRPILQRNGKTPPVFTIRNVFPIATQFHGSGNNGSAEDELRVLYAGTIGRAQDLKNAVEACKLAHQDGTNVHLRFVGSGAAKTELQRLSEDLKGAISFEPRHPADSLDEYYEWADTALVHLADWEPLTRTVPSKLYELMEANIHISAVVQGEAAELVSRLEAGAVVAPNDPESLAQLWIRLAEQRHLMHISNKGEQWVNDQRMQVAPQTLREVLNTATAQVES